MVEYANYEGVSISDAIESPVEHVSSEFSKDDNVYLSIDYDSDQNKILSTVGRYDEDGRDIEKIFNSDLNVDDEKVSTDGIIEMLSSQASTGLSDQHALMVDGRIVREGASEADAFSEYAKTILPKKGYISS